MKIEHDPGMMQSAEEHQEVPRENAVVIRSKDGRSGVGSGSQLQGDAESQGN
jgi:hypothetical protein